MNENNITKEQIEEILSEQNDSYKEAISQIMSNKSNFVKYTKSYDNEIFALKKIIKINKRAGNRYAAMRDEVLVKSYSLISSQNKMLSDVLSALDHTSSTEYTEELNKYVIENQLQNQEIIDVNYSKTLELELTSKTLKQAKQSIK